MTKPHITFIGAGNMASSLIGGLISKGVPTDTIKASDHSTDQCHKIGSIFAIKTFSNNAQAIDKADIIVLAVKPQIMEKICRELAQHIQPHQLVISIAAGITCNSLEKWLGPISIVRCMPNTPSLIGQGISGLFANIKVSNEQRQQTEVLLNAVGVSLWVEDETLIDVVVAVSGSGPAYFFLLVAAMSNTGKQLGLPAEAAMQLAKQTALGAAQMMVSTDESPEELRKKVTSPNGTTEAAIKSFQNNSFEKVVEQALYAAAQRSKELGQQLS
ncbi:UNVERIFIED_CONTAM: hypothetical protein GTU68_052133 [Idotea baltica]|nr:hypothetical protein [Idotea baltica]